MRKLLFMLFLVFMTGCQSTYTLEDDFPVEEEVEELSMRKGERATVSSNESARTADPEKIEEFLSMIEGIPLTRTKGSKLIAHHDRVNAQSSIIAFMPAKPEHAPFNFSIVENGEGLFIEFEEGKSKVGYLTETDHPELYEQIEDFYDTLYVRETHNLEGFNLEKMADGKASFENPPVKDPSPYDDRLTVEGTFEIFQEEEALKADPIRLEVRVNKEQLKLEKLDEPTRVSPTEFQQPIKIEDTVDDYTLTGQVIWKIKDYETIDITFD